MSQGFHNKCELWFKMNEIKKKTKQKQCHQLWTQISWFSENRGFPGLLVIVMRSF